MGNFEFTQMPLGLKKHSQQDSTYLDVRRIIASLIPDLNKHTGSTHVSQGLKWHHPDVVDVQIVYTLRSLDPLDDVTSSYLGVRVRTTRVIANLGGGEGRGGEGEGRGGEGRGGEGRGGEGRGGEGRGGEGRGGEGRGGEGRGGEGRGGEGRGGEGRGGEGRGGEERGRGRGRGEGE